MRITYALAWRTCKDALRRTDKVEAKGQSQIYENRFLPRCLQLTPNFPRRLNTPHAKTCRMSTRQLRRAAERKAAKQNRTEINRANSQHSTGPRTAEGKAASSQNAFKHGLYSKDLIMRGEDPAQLDALKADLRREHQPANTTEEILVNEMAEQFWRIRRYRTRETDLLLINEPADAVPALLRVLPIIQRFMTAAERGFHKALTTLRQLQKDRGFVPHFSQVAEDKADEPAVLSEAKTPEKGSVPQNTQKYSAAAEARWAEAVTYHGADPNDTELRDLMAADEDQFGA